MTAAAALARPRSGGTPRPRFPRRAGPARVHLGGPVPPLSPRLQLIRAVLMVVFTLTITLLLQLTFVSRFQHASAQQRLYDTFREQLALGTAPIGPADAGGAELVRGAPVALMEIDEIGLSEVIGEGTTAGVLFDGPGHRRDTPLPGQLGTTVLFGRRWTFGGPFADIDELVAGDEITLTTGQGEFTYAVLGVRFEGDPVPPPPAADGSRLVLVSAAGRAFLPNGVIRVDADLIGPATGGPSRAVTSAGLAVEEGTMASDPSTLWALALWLIALIALGAGSAWAWHRWGRAQAWVVCFPPLLLVGLAASGEAARLLPNLS